MSISTSTRKTIDAPHPTTSNGQTRFRSDSSPAKLSSPDKPVTPVMASSGKKVPRLDLSAHSANEATITNVSEPLLASPKSASLCSPRVRFASSLVGGSSSAPSTPRSKSPRPADEMRSPRRSRIDASPRKLPDSGKREIIALPETPMSPRKIHDELVQLGREAARLIFSEMTARTPVLTKATIDQLGRFETMIPVAALSSELRSRLPVTCGPAISHAQLIKTLYQPLLAGSEVGKTVSTMRRNVMELYDGHTLTIVDRVRTESADPEFKNRMLKNIEPQGRACAAVTFGMKSTALAESKLPLELIAFWKAMDAELCQWAGRNPHLDAAELKKARSNLGFDLLFTRLLLPMAAGPKKDAPLAIPAIFFDAVKGALLADWPQFVDSFISEVEQERLSSRSLPSSGGTSSTSATPVPAPAPEPRLKDGVFQD